MNILYSNSKKLFYVVIDKKFIYSKSKEELLIKIQNIEKEKGNYTLKQWIDIYFETYKKVVYKQRTYECEYNRMKRLKESKLGNYKLSEITIRDMQEFFNDLPLAPKTIKCIYTLINACLKQAVVEKIIESNPCEYCTLPKLKKPDTIALNRFQKDIFLEQAKDDKFYDVYLFALNTGMRESEILGLTKDCIDLSGMFIEVKQQRQKIKGSYIMSTLKTSTSYRKVPINATTYEIIKAHIRQPNDFLFLCNNKPISQSSLGKHIRMVYKKCYELTNDLVYNKANFHSLRHTFATQWVLQNGNIKLLSKVLGHTDTAFTMKVYVQTSYNDVANEMKKLVF